MDSISVYHTTYTTYIDHSTLSVECVLRGNGSVILDLGTSRVSGGPKSTLDYSLLGVANTSKN